MKKIYVLLCVYSMLICCASASELSDVSIIENQLFDVEYKNETISKRLDRIEEYLYGNIQTGTSSERIKRISDSAGISFEPKQTAEQKRVSAADFMPEDKNVTYPVIDMLEEQTFNKNFQGENIYKRLERLEQKAFGKINDGDLSSRTDKLKASILAIKPDKITYDDNYKPNTIEREYFYPKNNNNYETQSYYYSEDMGYPTGGAAGADVNYGLSALENFVFGDTYAHMSSNDRLSKLERKLLKKTFDNDDINSRMERIATVASAKGSSGQYSENKWAKYLSTGVQVGSIILMILAMIL